MTNVQKFAFYGGIVMLLMGLLALVPMFSSVPVEGLPALRLDAGYGLFLGWFPMNILNKIALIAFGIAGITAAKARTRSTEKSILFSRTVAWVMGIAAVLGMIPQTNTLYGYWPLYGAEIAMHGIFALMGVWFGYSWASAPVARRTSAPHRPAHRT